MPSPWVLRTSGWIIVLLGGSILVLNGGLGDGFSGKSSLSWIGAITFVLGMIVTSTAPLVSTLRHKKMLKQKIAEAHAIAHPPPPTKPG